MRLRSLAVFVTCLFAVPAFGQLPLGATAPTFSKSLLGGGSVTVPSQYAGKVVVLFLLGYG